MKKEDVLLSLKSAKISHVKWLEKAELLMNGLDLQDSVIPVDSAQCKFGQWFYGDGQLLKALSNNPLECMQNMEMLHSGFHEKYLNIFNIYFSKDTKPNFFAKLLGGKKKKDIDPSDILIAKENYSEMKTFSIKLIDEISRLERRLTAVSAEKIEALG